MKTRADVAALEKLIGQLLGLYKEMSQLAKKSANDALNDFKLRLVNSVIREANRIVEEQYRPLSGFDGFDRDEVPTNSDVTVVLAQYLEQVERYRSDNVAYAGYDPVYVVNGKLSDISASAPTRVGGDKK